MIESFQILYQDDYFIAINKPCGILVHRTNISEDTVFVLQLLRDQIGQRIYPIHRLDRATSGTLIFGKDKESAGALAQQFRDKTIDKTYLAIIRGFVEAEGTIDYAYTLEPHRPKKDAITHYKCLAQSTLDFSVGKYPTSRYSYVSITLETGRRHQIRRHFAYLRKPIIGDKRYGDVKHNNYWRNNLGIGRMLLHAKSLSFVHPVSQEKIIIEAELNEEFKNALVAANLFA